MKNDNRYNLTVPPKFVVYDGDSDSTKIDGIKWSGGEFVPGIGTEVTVRVNFIGKATVTGYFVEHGWLGLHVKPSDPPEWYVKQNGRGAGCHVFGAEITVTGTSVEVAS